MALARTALAIVAATLAAGTAAFLFACGQTSPHEPTGPIGDGDTGAVAAKVAAAFFHPNKDRIPHALATNPGEPWGDYVGSKACADCHRDLHAKWRDSFHSRTLYDAVDATVFGDFSGDQVFTDPRYGWSVRPFKQGGKFWMDIQVLPAWKAIWADPAQRWKLNPYYKKSMLLPKNPIGVWEVIYAFGNRRHQPYVVHETGGRYWVPPIYWNDVEKRWLYDGWRSYVASCASCHVTGIKTTEAPVNPDPFNLALAMTNPPRFQPTESDEGWAEGAVGCETCHGPGRKHIAKVKELGADAYREYVKKGERTIYCPSDGTPETRMSQCDSCHNFMSESSITWVPGPHGYGHEMIRRPIHPEGDGTHDEPQFYADGTHRSPCTVGLVFRESPMGKAGVECRACHDVHGNSTFGSLVQPLEGDKLCLSCHEHSDKFGTRETLEAHTHHKVDSPGSSCAECHMPRDKQFTNGVQIMSAHLHSHAMSTPTADIPPGAPPPSCLVCHTDKGLDWLRQTLARWYPPKKPR